MPTLDLGPVGAVLSPAEPGFVDTAVALEAMGYRTIWLTGGPMSSLDQVRAVVEATSTATVATGIIPVVRFPSDDVAALYTDLERTHPGRFVVGLGGAHGPDPMGTLRAYLDRLDGTVPVERRLLATLGPAMLRLACERSAGALPVLVTPGYTAGARAALGPDTMLAVEQLVVLETDADRARAIAHGPLHMLGQMPAYQANFRRMGFTQEEVDQRADRLLDALVAWGDLDAITARLAEQRAAGADHLAVSIVSASPAPTREEWQRLADVVVRG
jgi:probable F420-dependent oxidoreductase